MKQTSYEFPLGDETWIKKNEDTSQVCLGNIYQYPPSCCIWRKPKLSLQRLWMLRMLRMLHWLHRLQLHRWLMNGWCMLQWLWHWLHWLGHWLRHGLPSMNLSRCCLIARVDGTQIKRNNLGGLVWFDAKTQNGFKFWAAGIKTNSMVLKLMLSNTLSRFKNDSTALSLPVHGDLKLIEAHWSSILLHTNFKCHISTNEIFPKITNYKRNKIYEISTATFPKGRTKPKVSAAPQPAGGGLEKIEMQWMIQLGGTIPQHFMIDDFNWNMLT